MNVKDLGTVCSVASVNAFFDRLEMELVNSSELRPINDYRFWLASKNPMPRQERWERLRNIRADKNRHRIEKLTEAMDWLRETAPSIEHAYRMALVDMPLVQFMGRKDDALQAILRALEAVKQWHCDDDGYWVAFTEAQSDAQAMSITRQLERSDSQYPLSVEQSEEFRLMLGKAWSLLLRYFQPNQSSKLIERQLAKSVEQSEEVHSELLSVKGVLLEHVQQQQNNVVQHMESLRKEIASLANAKGSKGGLKAKRSQFQDECLELLRSGKSCDDVDTIMMKDRKGAWTYKNRKKKPWGIGDSKATQRSEDAKQKRNAQKKSRTNS
jgi:hypothetical protein